MVNGHVSFSGGRRYRRPHHTLLTGLVFVELLEILQGQWSKIGPDRYLPSTMMCVDHQVLIKTIFFLGDVIG